MLEGSLSPTVLEVSVMRLRLLFVSFSFSSSRFFSSKMKGKSVFKKELEDFFLDTTVVSGHSNLQEAL